MPFMFIDLNFEDKFNIILEYIIQFKMHLKMFLCYLSVLEEIDENIFNLPNDYSLAHCVAEDLRMGAGIAVDFK